MNHAEELELDLTDLEEAVAEALAADDVIDLTDADDVELVEEPPRYYASGIIPAAASSVARAS